ncbi:MAG: porin [Hyphomicrobiaceae bacterium]
MKLKSFGAALLVTSSFALAPAHAADFGGDCCADLEERIAELEATTARKGNRKVSLTISGHVNHAVMFWDDGDESNTYVVGNETSRSRIRFKGKAKINGDWSAGYRIEVGIRSTRSDRVDQNNDDAGGGIDIRHNSWFLKSKTLGQISVGQTSGATEGITEMTVASNGAHKNADPEDYFAGFQLRTAPGAAGLSGLEWRRLVKDNFIQPGEGSRGNYVVYKSPTIAGFNLLASGGEDDVWEVALKYAGEFGAFKVKGGIGYSQNTDTADAATAGCLFNNTNGAGDADCEQFGGSLSAMHTPTGLYLTFGAGQFTDNNTNDVALFQAANADDEHSFYSFTGGIQQKWNSLGKTTIFGEYFDHDGGANDRNIGVGDAVNIAAGLGASNILSSDVEVYGFGIVQKIDAAAMEIYAVYRHIEGDATLIEQATGNTANVEFEDLDVVMTGARIKF